MMQVLNRGHESTLIYLAIRQERLGLKQEPVWELEPVQHRTSQLTPLFQMQQKEQMQTLCLDRENRRMKNLLAQLQRSEIDL